MITSLRTTISVTKLPGSLVASGEFVRRRLLRLLHSRARYRYVKPQVQIVDNGWLVRSPCCSRKVDAEGGVIDIALISCIDGQWQLYARDHAAKSWRLEMQADAPDTLYAALLSDPERVFWP